MSLSAIFSEALYFFRNHLRQLAILTGPLLLLQVGLQLWLGKQMLALDQNNPEFSSMHMVTLMVLLLIFSWLIAALTAFLDWRSQGHEPTNNQVLFGSLQFVPTLLLAGVFSGMAIIAPVMLGAAFGGLWIIGLPISVYLFARLAYVNFMVVTEKLTPLGAIKSSFTFSGPIAMKTMLVLMMYIPLSLVGGTLSAVVAQAGLVPQLIMDTLLAFVGLFVNIALFRLYMVTRAQHAGE
ncbi:hypothetical protein L2725_15945 [Shewanella corallii]|uniref:Uncharacterized protein n=2 Tax=Shewanella TaxID=22 RepID=A0ABT0N9W3_9GAMM|nr:MULTISPECIES: hypothetical protein [Shewanella]MCL1038937.1 hypothetical protein [Shewanella submarina]MCL2915253.1 hypothetical protein [Shewanella corallii]